jgi:hypothetical protein
MAMNDLRIVELNDEFHGKNKACHGDNEVAKAAF